MSTILFSEAHVSKMAAFRSELQFYQSTIGMEGFSLSSVGGMFKRLAINAQDTLNYINGLIEPDKKGASSQTLTTLTQYQKDFLKVVKGVRYTSVDGVLVNVPEGFKGHFLDYAKELVVCADHCLEAVQAVTDYEVFLTRFATDRKFALSAVDDKKAQVTAQKEVEDLHKRCGKYFNHNDHNSRRKLKEVIARNNDWEAIYKLIDEATVKISGIDRKALQNKINQCVSTIGVIVDAFGHDKDRGASKESADRLGEMTYTVAKKMELLSITYYRILQLQSAVLLSSDTIRETME
jgi:hypothetical protein